MPDRQKSVDISDEQLMAFVDGEIEPEERDHVKNAVARSAALRARLNIFEKTNRSLSRHYDHVLHEPVPAHLLELIRNAEIKEHQPNILWRLASRLRDLMAVMFTPRVSWATASTVSALILGIGLGTWIQSKITSPSADRHALLSIENNHIWARGALHEALERIPSGSSKSLENPSNNTGSIVPVQTFRDRTGRYCREYAVTATPEKSAVGIACRNNSSQWSIEMHTAQPSDGIGTTSYRPASGTGIARLNALMAEIREGDPLDLDQEETAILQGWP